MSWRVSAAHNSSLSSVPSAYFEEFMIHATLRVAVLGGVKMWFAAVCGSAVRDDWLFWNRFILRLFNLLFNSLRKLQADSRQTVQNLEGLCYYRGVTAPAYERRKNMISCHFSLVVFPQNNQN